MSKINTALKLANLERAAADQRLTHLAYRLLSLMVSDADGRTGIVRRRQARFAKVLGVHRRTVQRCRDHLVEFGYLWPLGEVSIGIINGYSVLPPEHAAPAPHVDVTPAPQVAAKHAAPAPHLCGHTANMRHQDRRDAAPAPPTCGTSAAHNPLSSPLRDIPCADRETGAGAPRGLEGLGAPPFGAFDAELRSRLGERIKWLATMRLVDRSPDTVTLSALTTHQADNARAHCEADILAVTGAARLVFDVKINTAELPKLRSVAS